MWKFFVVPGVTMALFIALSIGGGMIESQGLITSPEGQERAGTIGISIAFALFLVLGYSVIPLFIRLFILGQIKIGNGERAPIKALRQYEKYVVLGIWAFYTVGILIAFPAMIADGFFSPGELTK